MRDFIIIDLCKPPTKLWEKEKKIKENQIAIRIVTQIIKKSVTDNIHNNIINITD